jgi:hypothetical protein
MKMNWRLRPVWPISGFILNFSSPLHVSAPSGHSQKEHGRLLVYQHHPVMTSPISHVLLLYMWDIGYLTLIRHNTLCIKVICSSEKRLTFTLRTSDQNFILSWSVHDGIWQQLIGRFMIHSLRPIVGLYKIHVDCVTFYTHSPFRFFFLEMRLKVTVVWSVTLCNFVNAFHVSEESAPSSFNHLYPEDVGNKLMSNASPCLPNKATRVLKVLNLNINFSDSLKSHIPIQYMYLYIYNLFLCCIQIYAVWSSDVLCSVWCLGQWNWITLDKSMLPTAQPKLVFFEIW